MEDAVASVRVSNDVALDDVRLIAAKLFAVTQGDACFEAPAISCSSHAACNDVQVVLLSRGREGRESSGVDRCTGPAASAGCDGVDIRGISSVDAADWTGMAACADATPGDDAGWISTTVGADVAAAATTCTAFPSVTNGEPGEMPPATASTVSASSTSAPAPIARRYLKTAVALAFLEDVLPAGPDGRRPPFMRGISKGTTDTPEI
jgi:hypothetical protein